jgi:V8-like Glu-specific endopeptidase
MKEKDINSLIALLSSNASTSPIGSKKYFRDLVNQSNLPPKWVYSLADIWTGDASYDSGILIRWAIVRRINPNDQRFTTLGSILNSLIQLVGFDDASFIAAVIVIYNLFLDSTLIYILQSRYQIPLIALNSNFISSEILDTEFKINWHDPVQEEELQSWFQSEPEFLDVGFLAKAIQQSASVCKVEVQSQGNFGTGFLISQRLLLTNYHILKINEDSDIDTNANSTVLHFGCFTSNPGTETQGQTFRLSRERPILKQSPKDQLDYVLLQVDENIMQANEVRPVSWNFQQKLSRRMSLNILQHPEGSVMKLSMNCNAVTGIYEDSNRIQYVSRTTDGSSGSPCFDDNWNVVALHHSRQSTAVKSVGEGILFKSIFDEIKSFLH